MTWLENGELISNAKSSELISKNYQSVEGVLMSPDNVNDLIRSGYTRPHLAVPLKYTLTYKEKKNLGSLGIAVLGVSVFSLGTWKLSQLAKKKIDSRKKENL